MLTHLKFGTTFVPLFGKLTAYYFSHYLPKLMDGAKKEKK